MVNKNERILGIHVGLAVAEIFCATGFFFELDRARSGNTLSWAYVFEWPIFAGYAIYMWRRLVKDVSGNKGSRQVPDNSGSDDDALARYNQYLRDVHDRDSGASEHLETHSFDA